MDASRKDVMSPRAFISHASEDKDRFVLDFATQLRAKGIEAWLDRWEIKAGDSLVDKIFEEGIKNAEAFIVVISSHSINKRWVREELDSGVVRKIDKSCRLIPVIIDDCEVPQVLRHLKWVKIANLSNYEAELSEITSAIYGTSDKPPLGLPPAHAMTAVVNFLPELTKADNLVFRTLCQHYMQKGEKFFQIKDVYENLMVLGFGEDEIDESLNILAGRGYIGVKKIGGVRIWGIQLYSFSLDAFVRVEVPDYGEKLVTIISKIVNESVDTNSVLQETTGIPMPVVLHVLDLMEEKGLLRQTGPAGLPFRKILQVSPELKRILRQP
jgi:hypothetical protein